MRTIAETDDWKLLRSFVEAGSQRAFGELVSRHIDLVYSVALRETRDEALAQDVTQAVFLLLFRKAPTIRRGTVLAGWLFNTARLASRNAVRGEMRRKKMEQELIETEMAAQDEGHGEAWRAIEPLLHQAIASLGAKDRAAILLRFFEDKSLREVAAELGTTEKAAQMRVARALEKLRKYLQRNGVALPVAVLGSVLLERAVAAAPASCAQAVGRTVFLSGPASAEAHLISQEVLKSMFVSKLKAASLVAALSVGSVVGAASFSGAVASRGAETPRTIPTPNPALPSGVAILQKSKAAYTALSTYDGGTTSHTESVKKDKIYEQNSTANVKFQRPDSLRVQGIGIDGEPYALTYASKEEKPLAFLQRMVGSTGGTTIPSIFLGDGFTNRFWKTKAAKLEGSENIGSAMCYRVSFVELNRNYALATRYVLWVDAKTFLLRRLQRDYQYPLVNVITFSTQVENFTINSAS